MSSFNIGDFFPMSQLVKLEKRFEDAIEKLEFALTNKIVRKDDLDGLNEKQEVSEQNHDITENLLNKIRHLEKAAKNDAKEIDKLVMKLKEILETDND